MFYIPVSRKSVQLQIITTNKDIDNYICPVIFKHDDFPMH